jgi:hypothetical protein
MVEIERLEAEVDVDAKKAAAELKALDKAIDKAARDRTANIHYRVNRKGIVEARDELGRYNRVQIQTSEGNQNLTSSFRKLNSAVGAGGSIMKVMALPALIATIQPAVTGINALAAGVIGLTSALRPLSGYLATIPTGITMLASTFGAVSLSLGEVSTGLKEIETAKTAEEVEAALGKLSPAAREFTDLVRGDLAGALASLRATSSSAFLPGFQKGIEAALPSLGMLNTLLADAGTVAGGAIEELGKLVNTGPFQESFAKITETSGMALRDMADALVPLINGFATLAAESAPLVTQLSKGLLDLATSFDRSMTAGQKSGSLADFFEKAARTGSQVVSVVKDIGGAIGNVLDAASGLGGGLLSSLESGADALNKWTSEAGNMEKMAGFFDSLRGPLDAAGRLIKELGRGWMELNDPAATTALIDQITQDLVPAIIDVAKAAQDAFGPELIDTISEVTELFGSLMGHSGALTTFVDLIGGLASALNSLNDAIPFLGELVAAFGIMKVSMGAMNLVGNTKLIGTFVEVMRAGGTAGQGFASSMRAVSSSGAGVGAAIGLSLVAVQQFKQLFGDADKAAQGYMNTVKEASDKAAASGFDAQKEHLAAVGDELQSVRARLVDLTNAEDLSVVFNAKAIRSYQQMRDGLIEEERAIRESMRATWDLHAATGATTGEAHAFITAQRALGVEFSSTAAAARAYEDALRGVVAESKRAMEAAFETRDSLIESAASADQELAAAQEDYSRAMKQNVIDTRALRNAQENAAEAAKDLANSYAEAAEHLEDLRFAQRRAVLSEARAVNALQDAYDRLQDIQKDVGKVTKSVTQVTDDFTGKIFEVTRLTADAADAAQDQKQREKELRDALLDIAEAQLALEIARDSSLDAQKALTEAERKGIMQSDLVVNAQRRLRDANEAVTDAIKAQQDRAEQNALAQKRAAERVEAAQKRQVAAHKAVRDYVAGPLTDAINQYNRDLEKLNRTIRTRLEFEAHLAAESKHNLELFMSGVLLGFPVSNPPKDLATSEDLVGFASELLTGHARGGFAPYGQPALFGEHGPEIGYPHPSGTGMNILPAGPTAQVLGRSGGSDIDWDAALERLADVMKPTVNLGVEMTDKTSPDELSRDLAWRLGGS